MMFEKGRLARRALAALTMGVMFALGICAVLPSAADADVLERSAPRKGRSVRALPKKAAKRSIFAGGDGSAKRPYIIKNGAQLGAFAASVNGGNTYKGKTIRLDADIDLGYESWSPIGRERAVFSGVFNGNGHTIYRLSTSGGSYAGLFGRTMGATVANLHVSDADIRGTDRVGAVIGAAAQTVLKNCSATGRVSGGNAVGGLVGSAEVCKLDKNNFSGIVSGTDIDIGGLVGSLSSTSLTDSGGKVNVSGRENTGGAVGSVYAGAMSRVAVRGSSVRGITNTGGLAGAVLGKAGIREASFAGDINGDENVGGITGLIDRGSVSDTSSAGSVMGRIYVGGIGGLWHIGDALRCSSSSLVSGSAAVGGAVGQMDEGSLSQCSSRGEVRGADAVGGLIGRLVNGAYTGCTPSRQVYSSLASKGYETGLNPSERHPQID